LSRPGDLAIALGLTEGGTDVSAFWISGAFHHISRLWPLILLGKLCTIALLHVALFQSGNLPHALILVFMLRLVNNPRIMGRHTNPRWLNVVAWGLTGLVILLTAVLFGSTLAGWLGWS